MEQYYRDNRLNPIHEGTHGIQALDLLGRKPRTEAAARACKQLIRLIADTRLAGAGCPALTALREPLEHLVARLQSVTIGLLTDLAQGKVRQQPGELGAVPEGIRAYGDWLALAGTGDSRRRRLSQGNAADAAFYKGKLQAARYFLTWEVPGCHHELAILEARDDTCLGMQDEWF